MLSKKYFVALVALAVFASGCGSSRTSVYEGNKTNYKSSSMVIQVDTNKQGAQIDAKYRIEFEQTLRQSLLNKGFRDGNGLIVKYWFSEADEGSRAARYFVGFGTGTGKLQIVVEYYDSNGNKLSATSNEGTVSGGTFGGNFSEAIKNATDAIATFAQRTYLGRDTNPAPKPIVQQQQPVQVAPPPSSPAPTPPPAAAEPPANQPPSTPVVGSVPAPPTTPAPQSTAPAPNAGLKTWQIAVNTIPSGALIKAFDANQELYQVGKSPAGFLWPIQTQADAMVIIFQGRQVTLLPNTMESITVDFSKQPPEVKGATIIDNGHK